MNKPRLEEIIIDVDEYEVHLYLHHEETKLFLTEARHKGIPIRGPYSTQKHSPHTSKGQNHLHLYKGQNQIAAINKDGTAHDRSHNTQIPKKVIGTLKQLFPDYNIPDDGYVESASRSTEMLLKIQEATGSDIKHIIRKLLSD